MTNTGNVAAATFYTDPNTGRGLPCTILSQDGDGMFRIAVDGSTWEGWVSAGELYCMDESGRYLGGPIDQ